MDNNEFGAGFLMAASIAILIWIAVEINFLPDWSWKCTQKDIWGGCLQYNKK